MALAGRTWAQVARGIPAAGEAALGGKAALEAIPDDAAAHEASRKPGLNATASAAAEQAAAQVPHEATSTVELTRASPPPGLSLDCSSEAEVIEEEVAAGLEDALTETCDLSSPATDLAPASSAVDMCQRSEVSTTASERGGNEHCILCSGTGMLCSGVLSDPCPLCETADGAVHDECHGVEASSAIGSSSSEVASERNGKDDCHSSAAEAIQQKQPLASVNVMSDGTAMAAPPGLGPPGVWVWSSTPKLGSDATELDSEQETRSEDGPGVITWPNSTTDSVEVEFVGMSAQLCFGTDFLKMTVSWADKWLEEKMSMPIANLQMHVSSGSTATLGKLQAVLGRDQKIHQCHIFRMAKADNDASMTVVCAAVSANSCWDVLRKGFCPRGDKCTWEHPAPILLNVCFAGTLPEKPLATLLQAPFANAVLEDNILTKKTSALGYLVKEPPPVNSPIFGQNTGKNINSLNFVAFRGSESDSESSDEM